ncbi:MAG: hypothetical protein ACOYJQ_12140 [Pseudochelatococcus sp.]|uniref:hypothetical protein n=1 Tax=Pseudochelatococcus sp. TaxID=2020869 RepID=UPI003D935A6B
MTGQHRDAAGPMHWSDFRERRPGLAARVLLHWPHDLDVERVQVSSTTLGAFASLPDLPQALSSLEVLTLHVLPSGEGDRHILGYLLHDRKSRTFVPLSGENDILRVLSILVPDPDARYGAASRFRLWWRLGEPAFEGLELVEKAAGVPEEALAGYPHADALRTFTLDSATADWTPGQERTIFARGIESGRAGLYALTIGFGNFRTVFGIVFRTVFGIVRRDFQFSLPSDARIRPQFLGSEDVPWADAVPSGAMLTDVGRRRKVLTRFSRSEQSDPGYVPPELVGDVNEIDAEARRDYEVRCRDLAWRPLLPAPDDDAALARKAEQFVDYVNFGLRDLHLPESLLLPAGGDRAGRDCAYTARIKPLPFYDCYDLIEVTEHVGGRSRKTFLLWAAEDAVPSPVVDDRSSLLAPLPCHVALDSTSDPIHKTNFRLLACNRFGIGRSLVRPYLEFFCHYMHLDDRGSFTIVESVDALNWRGFSRRQIDAARPVIRPMRVWDGANLPDEEFDDLPRDLALIVEANVINGGGLYRSVFAIVPDGRVKMIVDSALLPDLSTQSYKWQRKTQFLLSWFEEFDR